MKAIFALIILLCAPVLAQAAPHEDVGSRLEAVAMVKRVQTMFDKDGPEKTFNAISDKTVGEFHDRDLYPFVYTFDGTCVAHGARPALIGKNLIDLKDQDGKYLIREMAERSQAGDGWISYKWPNPLTNKIEDKASYFVKLGEHYFVGVGVYGASQ